MKVDMIQDDQDLHENLVNPVQQPLIHHPTVLEHSGSVIS